ncbi:ABC transporter permease [Ruminiclostridium cellulolyticum]|uniref:Binding-protein-dependent transport systems inner membrane component n=1 Tax=Ruminiclostridium cellulolyticum (strain ATCC 35319 / DSM 5812 / JCM 6584 / H10) TaxID=394503 RepID=B8I6C6_RUMCH|nr:ABC transporter permease [Ruminiclostridium cellulolyticum]ACL74818.1 binding-protein-dependent transport systems inner membrane component [Ruminiclostridium cellulolyticum H10]
MKKLIHILVSFALILILWQGAVSLGYWNQALLPSPPDVGNGFLELVSSGTLFAGVKSSMYRFFVGYLLAAFSAVTLGLVLGWFRNAWSFVNPVVQLVRPISPIAWFPFIVLIFGIGDLPAIVIIFIAAFFPILLATVNAVGKVDQTYIKVAKNFGIKQPMLLTKIVLPAAFPSIASGLHIALGTAWVFLVAGEMVGAQTGLGFMIIDARNNLRADLLLANILSIGIIGLILDSFIGLAEKQLLKRWGVIGGNNVY